MYLHCMFALLDLLFLDIYAPIACSVQPKTLTLHCLTDLSGLLAEIIQATGDIGTQWILDLCSGVVKDGCIQEDW